MRGRMSCAMRQSCRTGCRTCALRGASQAISDAWGSLSFVTLSDMEGKLQIAVMRDEVGEDTV